MPVLIKVKNSSLFTKKNKKTLTELQPKSNKILVYKLYNQYMQNKIKTKLHINLACFKLEEKTNSVKKNNKT